MTAFRFVRPAVAVLGIGLVLACSEAPDPTGAAPDLAIGDIVDRTPLEHKLVVCKVGSIGVVKVTSEFRPDDPDFFTLDDGDCVEAHQWGSTGFPTPTDVMLTEIPTEGFLLDQIVVENFDGSNETITGTSTIPVGPGDLVTFFNVPENGGDGEGCTPGYWKQPHHFDSWVGFSPGDLFSDVFDNAFPGMTLLQVLEQGGGGLKALGRHTVAALLNASSSVDSGFSVDDVIDAFNDALASGDFEGQKNIFEASNEQGCPLN